MWTSVNHTSDIRSETPLADLATLQRLLYLREMPPSGSVRSPQAVRLSGVAAMRALAHPTRLRMLDQLRHEPLSASELARRLEIRFGSARFHLHQLVDGGLALPAGERRVRGGLELLFSAPDDVWWTSIPTNPATTATLHRALAQSSAAGCIRRVRPSPGATRPWTSCRSGRSGSRPIAGTRRSGRGGRAPADPGVGRAASDGRHRGRHARPVPVPDAGPSPNDVAG